MQFSDKLVFLMNITMTSNKELATGISVDPSLISLFRTGKRKQPQHPGHIKNMAHFFAKKCSGEFQRNALAEMMDLASVRSSMPTQVLERHLENWLEKDSDFVDSLMDNISTIPTNLPPVPEESEFSEPYRDASFFFGEEGRREVMKKMMQIIRSTKNPGTLLISSDDNLEWLLSDYTLTKQILSNMLEIVDRGFTIIHIMPAMNFMPRFTDSLRFWLPIYATGKVQVYYYPRFRDTLYRRSIIVQPGRCVRISSAIGLGSSSDVTMFSTDPQVVEAHVNQYNEILRLCRPALSVHHEPADYIELFKELDCKEGTQIVLANLLSAVTIPRTLFEQLLSEITNPGIKAHFQAIYDRIDYMEETLNESTVIELIRLAKPEEIRSGKAYISFPFAFYPDQPVYTPQTYIMHLKNILRLMEEYENYYFIPCNDEHQKDYNLAVNDGGLALLTRTSAPSMVLEMRRPEMVLSCQEHLLQAAEKLGYKTISKKKFMLQIQELIRELQN
ncbi:MAG: hypothetical protein ACI4CC_06625 [Lachnospiraceae bacterium]